MFFANKVPADINIATYMSLHNNDLLKVAYIWRKIEKYGTHREDLTHYSIVLDLNIQGFKPLNLSCRWLC